MFGSMGDRDLHFSVPMHHRDYIPPHHSRNRDGFDRFGRDREVYHDRDRDRDRDRGRDREHEKERDREKDRDRVRDRDKERDREREREGYVDRNGHGGVRAGEIGSLSHRTEGGSDPTEGGRDREAGGSRYDREDRYVSGLPFVLLHGSGQLAGRIDSGPSRSVILKLQL